MNIKKMNLIFKRLAITLLIAATVFSSIQAQQKRSGNEKPLRFEHLATNVPEPVKTADWYKDNLGMKIMRPGTPPTFTTFIADPGENMMFEFYHNEDAAAFNPAQYNNLSLHIAFLVSDINKIKASLIEAGATVADDLRKTDSGDQVLTLRDPWGLPIQFVERVKPMLNLDGTEVRFEHIAVNVKDAREVAKWYQDNMGMVLMQESGAPNYGRFIANAGKNMMLELYQNDKAPFINFYDIDFLSLHLASMSSDMEATKNKLVKAGATVVQDINKSPAGDLILVLRDPWGFPLQFVQRINLMLKN